MPPQPLPLECVLSILHFLSEDNDTDTMAHLLCVNKTICAATLPFLYGGCFNFDMYQHRPHSKKKRSLSMLQLIRTLLRQIRPQNRISGLLQAVCLPQDDHDDSHAKAELTPIFKYNHFIRRIVLDPDLIHNVYDFRHNPHVMEYAETHQLYEKYLAEGLASGIHRANEDKNHLSSLGLDVRRQLTWVLCQDRLESVEELSIPLNDIERYIGHVSQFTSLSKVIFTVEKTVHISAYMYSHSSNYTRQEDRDRRDKELEIERDRLFRAMVQFVQRHTSIHENVLRHVVIPVSSNLPRTNQHSTVDVHFEILALLPPPENPRLISHFNWYQLLARLPDTNLDHVEAVNLTPTMGADYIQKTLALMSNQPLFLSRCRSLKRLEIETLEPNMFQWAVSEKKQKDAAHQGSIVTSRQDGLHSDLVPVRYVEIVHKTPLEPVQELNDVAFAFGDSLEEFTMRDKWDFRRTTSSDLNSAHRVVHGQGWTLPRLRVLDFEALYSRLYFDLDALQRFPALESIRLVDGIVTYNHREIQFWPCVSLPHLKKLELVGSPALHFNMSSLHYSQCLEYLALKMPISFMSFYIPPLEDMATEDPDTQISQDAMTDDNGLYATPGTSQGYQAIGRRPRFTWDWYLPNLQKLVLEAVFAFKFDFQWLQHLPSLVSIYLNTYSENGHHERSITLNDLSRGPRHQRDENEGQRNLDRYISLPKLGSVDLYGQWIIDAEVMDALCLVVAPNLREMRFGANCVGHTLDNLVKLTRKMPCLESIHSGRWFMDDEIADARLTSLEGPQEGNRGKKPVEYFLSERQFWDVQEP